MDPISRLARELKQLSGMLEAPDMARYLGHLVLTSPAIVASRTLVAADRRMNRLITVRLRDKRIRVPVGEITVLLGADDPTPTFGAVREMYAGNIYLAPFAPDLRVETAVDLGANRGLFSVLAAVVLEARTIVGIEPSAYYEPVFACLVRANRLEGCGLHRITAFGASMPGAGRVTLEEVMARFGMDRIGFLKCDIEGGEFDIFLNNNRFLERVDNIAMELHSIQGDSGKLLPVLEAHGFGVRVMDQMQRAVAIEHGHYLYAARSWRK